LARPANNHENKKIELLSIAESIFLIKGYEQTSIADILKESGISKGGFYHYFSSKEDILSESISKIIDESIEYLRPVIEDKSLDALEKFKLFMIKKSEFQKDKIEYRGKLIYHWVAVGQRFGLVRSITTNRNKLHKIYKKINPSIIHAQGCSEYALAAPKNIPLIVTIHGVEVYSKEMRATNHFWT